MTDLQLLEYRNQLLLTYGSLLTDMQRKMMEDYYQYNLSLSEISENYGVSRAAVSDCLKKSELKLEDYENKLHYLQKKKEMQARLEVLKKLSKEEILEELERMMDDGI